MRVSNGIEIREADESRLEEARADGFVPLVSVTNGQETREVHPDKLALAEADGFYADNGALDTAVDAARGAAQGVTLGFGDELAGANESLAYAADSHPLATAASLMNPGTAGKTISEAVTNFILAQKNTEGAREAYVSGRDSERASNRRARERSPVAYGGGQLAGAGATSLATGGGAAALTGAGAAEGLGSSDADLLEGDVLEAGKDAVLGGAAGLAAAGAGKAIGSVAGRGKPAARALDPYLPAHEQVEPGMVRKGAELVGRAGEKVGDFFNNAGDLTKSAFSLVTAGKSNAIQGAARVAEKIPDIVEKGATISLETIERLAPQLGRFGSVLMQAAQRGGNALATTNFLLQQTEPEYQEALKKLNEN